MKRGSTTQAMQSKWSRFLWRQGTHIWESTPKRGRHSFWGQGRGLQTFSSPFPYPDFSHYFPTTTWDMRSSSKDTVCFGSRSIALIASWASVVANLHPTVQSVNHGKAKVLKSARFQVFRMQPVYRFCPLHNGISKPLLTATTCLCCPNYQIRS